MKRNMKGFTLIELLAVIVILAIIALIATPIILNVIEEAKDKSVVNSAYGVIDAAKLAHTQDMYADKDAEGYKALTDQVTDLKVSGEAPTAGTWVVTDGQIVITDVTFGEYKCNNTAAAPKVTCSIPSEA